MQLVVSRPADYHAALYIRLSKEDESEGPSQSVTNQQSLLDQFVQAQQLSVYDTYIDDGWSGTHFDRPAFQRMLRDIQAKKVNMVITKDLSRLGRDYIMTGHYMERFFPEHQVRYISLLDGIDTGVDSTANDITPFRAIMNDMYAKDISKKIKSVKRDKQRKGLFIGGKPVYGYRMHPTEKNHIVVDEEAAVVVRRIYAMALQGVSCRQIAMQLNEAQIPSPSVYAGLAQARQGAGLWSGERISDMLQNQTYIGHMVQGRSAKISYKSKKCQRLSREDWLVVENTHAPIVSQAVFDKVQTLLAGRKRTRLRTYDFPLKGLIFCHECGQPLGVINRKNARGEDRLYFVCRTYQRYTKAGACTCHTIKEKTVTDAVLAALGEACKPYLNQQWLLPLARQAVDKAERGETNERAPGIEKKIQSLTANLDRMYMDKLNGLLTEDDFKRLYTRTKAERAALAAQLSAVPRPAASPGERQRLAASLTRQFIEEALRRRELLCALVERIELTEDKRVLVRCRFGLEGEGTGRDG